MAEHTAPQTPSGWPYPDTEATAQPPEAHTRSPEKSDPVEQALVDEQIARDKKATQAVDSEIARSKEQ